MDVQIFPRNSGCTLIISFFKKITKFGKAEKLATLQSGDVSCLYLSKHQNDDIPHYFVQQASPSSNASQNNVTEIPQKE